MKIKKTIFRSFALGMTSVSLLAAVGCSPKNNETLSLNPNTAGLMPRPSDAASERAQLSRYRGQTQFLNAQVWSYSRGGLEASPAASAKSDAGGGARAEQESDIFKVGKPGSKLLFLLNNYRGLQVVSFADGAEKPKLLGRVQPTGNSPDEMYYDENHDRLIVIENVYNYGDDEGPFYRRAEGPYSRLVIYDVSQPEKPAISASIDLEGTVADSRIVGNVLYVATSAKEKGAVASYNLTRKDLAKIDSRELKLPVSYAQNMNIVSVQKGDSFKYYLLATLSESGWGWWDRSSVIEVIDISDEKGQIHPLMSVAAKGVVRERSQTMIKNDTLIVTSNYTIDRIDAVGRNIARIAVETFRFPTKDSEVLDENEATYRKLHIDRELKGLSGQAYDQALERLVSDANLGIKGRFLKSEGELRKMTPDSIITVGDGSGLSANLQDVRYQGDLLYAFWVPANQIDPFDLFDISEPEKGVKYISRLQFDGWIQRAIPMDVGGRRFILGLGWIVPVVNNETGRRQPQAMIFEIVENHGKLRALDVAQFTFEGSNIWTDFNGQDKEIEIRMDGEGKGEILFNASKYDSSGWDEGGQLVRFDLQSILAGNYEGSLKKGAFLSGGSDWIRRVFTNSEISRINSFSDRALATFGVKSSSEGSIETETLAPVHMLELARNLRGYETLKKDGKTFGVQIVGDYSWSSNGATTELRAVAADKADSELPGALSVLKISGNYLDHLIDRRTGDLVLLTNHYEQVKEQNGNYNYKNVVEVTTVGTNASGALSERGHAVWTVDRQETPWMPLGLRIEKGFVGYGYDSNSLVQLEDGTVLAQVDSGIQVVSTAAGVAATSLDLGTCVTKDRHDVEIQVLDGKLYLASKEAVESREFEGLELSRNFIAPATLKGHQLSCGTELNVPGRVMAITKTGEVLVDDRWAEDIVVRKEVQTNHSPIVVADIAMMPVPHFPQMSKFEVLSRESLISLKVKDAGAVLVDEMQKPDAVQSAKAVGGGAFVNLVPARGWGQSTHELQFLSLGEDGTLQSESYGIATALGKQARISALAVAPNSTNSFIALIQAGAQVQAISWKTDAKRPVLQKLVALNESFERQEAAEVIRLSQSYSWWGGEAAHFSGDSLSFELIQGMGGITQLFIEQ